MREILFKAKRKDNGEWVEGYYCKTTIGNDVRPSDVIFVPFKVSRNEEWGWMKVDSETLCQYTGLEDKNGNKIWENDIVYIRSNGLSGKGTIQYKEGCLVLVDEKRERTYNLYGEWKIRKDGNIFDNAELLEV